MLTHTNFRHSTREQFREGQCRVVHQFLLSVIKPPVKQSTKVLVDPMCLSQGRALFTGLFLTALSSACKAPGEVAGSLLARELGCKGRTAPRRPHSSGLFGRV